MEIIKEYLEIGKVNAGILSEKHSSNYGDYRLKGYELPAVANDVPINSIRLQIAIDRFQCVINLCNQFNFNYNSPYIVSANEYITMTHTKISEYRIFKDFK